MLTMERYLLPLALVVAATTAAYFAAKYMAMVKRFKPVLALEAEASRVRDSLEKEKAGLTREIAEARASAAKLGNNYAEAKSVYDRLQLELSLLQAESEDMSFGVYKPQYSFDASDTYKAELDKVYEQKKAALHNGTAATKVGKEAVQKRRQKLILRAFNGECDAATAKVKWNNATRMEERIRKAYAAINVLGDYVTITHSYLELCLAELRLTHEFETKK